MDTLSAIHREMDKFHPDLVVLDVRMPDGDGIEAAHLLLQRCPGVKILFLSMHNEPHLVKRALETGALGYVSKRVPARELMLAIRTALNGDKYVGACTHGHATNGNGQHHALTERQKEVLRLIAQGRSPKEIASYKTILSG